jgi:hypothetical protein
LESARDKWLEADSRVLEIDVELEEKQEEEKGTYIELLNRVKDALIEERQKEIDKLVEINDSINETNSKIIEGL